MLSKVASSTIFRVLGMTRLRIELWSSWPLANTVLEKGESNVLQYCTIWQLQILLPRPWKWQSTSLLLNIVIIPLNSNVLPPNESMYSLSHKILLTVLWVTSSSLANVCLLNPLTLVWRDDSLKALNLVSMENAVMSSFWMTMLNHT